jgi:hypothetical protein
MVPGDEVTREVGVRPPLRLRRRLVGIGAGLAAFGLFRLLSSRPGLAEHLAGAGPLPALGRTLSLTTGVLPFSVAEAVVLVVIGRQIGGLLGGIGDLRGGHDRLGRTFLRGGLRLGQDAGVLVALFVALWGIQYARPGLEERLGIEVSGPVSAQELERLARAAVETSNRLYFTVHGSRDIGEPTPAPPRRELVPELERAWERVARHHGLPERAARSHGAPKAFLATPAVRRLGVAGMYFPFTGEALVLSDLPGVSLPRDMGHEMAHQRGFASESDANVLAFLVAREAMDPLINYSAYVFLQRQLISALAVRDPGAAMEVIQARYPGVQRDVESHTGYWRGARGWTRTMSLTLNHAMLRAHGVPGGIASYRGSTWVFTALAREGGVEALLPPVRGSEAWSEVVED